MADITICMCTLVYALALEKHFFFSHNFPHSWWLVLGRIYLGKLLCWRREWNQFNLCGSFGSQLVTLGKNFHLNAGSLRTLRRNTRDGMNKCMRLW